MNDGFFQYHQGVKQFGSRSGSKLFVMVINSQQKSPLAGKELNTKQLVDTTFWLKSWLKLISFVSNFFHLAKVLAARVGPVSVIYLEDNYSLFGLLNNSLHCG